MVQSGELLFPVNRSSQGSIDEKAYAKKEVRTSEFSFEELLNNSKKDLKSSRKAANKNTYKEEAIKQNTYNEDEKAGDKILFQNPYGFSVSEGQWSEDNEDIDSLTSLMSGDGFGLASNEVFMELFAALMSSQNGSGDNATENLIESIKLIATSIQNASIPQSVSSVNTIDGMQETTKSMLSSESNIGSTQEAINPLFSNNMVFNTDSEVLLPDSMVNTPTAKGAANISSGMDTNYNSPMGWILNSISAFTGAEPREIMALMQAAGLGDRVLLSSANGEISVDAGGNESKADILMKFQNSNINISDEMSAGIENIKAPEGNNTQNFNTLDDMFLSSHRLDSISVVSLNTGSNSPIIDFTKIMDSSNPVGSIEIIRELAEKVSMNLRDNRYEMELQIKPEHLGKLILKVTLEDGILSGRIYTTTEQSRDILQNNLGNLRTVLEEQGYIFSQLDVNVGNHESTQDFQYPGRDRTNMSERNLTIDSLDDMAEERSEFVKSYMNSSEIDYFA